MNMLPQAVCSPMDSDSLLETSLPPDICLKSGSAADEPVESIAWKNAPHGWAENRSSPITETIANDVNIESQSVQAVAHADLTQSACQTTTDQERSAEGSCPVSGTLPDLCEGASSSRLSSDSDLSEESPVNQWLLQVEDQKSTSSMDTNHISAEADHETLGAKPKVFNYRSAAKRTELDKCSHSVLKTSCKKGCRDKSRTTDASHVQSSVRKQDNFDNSRIDTEVPFDQSAFTSVLTYSKTSTSILISSKTSSTKEVKGSPGNLSRNSDENYIDVLDNQGHCDESSTDTFRPENDGITDKCNAASVESLLEKASPSLMEEYLLYDSRPISLVACGIWDCDSRSGLADNTSKGLSGLVLMRNNLHSASHPMFAKWPCEAYIPSHILVEVAFNSHGTSLGAATVCSYINLLAYLLLLALLHPLLLSY